MSEGPHPRSVAPCRLCGRVRSIWDLTERKCSGTWKQMEECARTLKERGRPVEEPVRPDGLPSPELR